MIKKFKFPSIILSVTFLITASFTQSYKVQAAANPMQPATFDHVSYEFAQNVNRLPQDLSYEMKDAVTPEDIMKAAEKEVSNLTAPKSLAVGSGGKLLQPSISKNIEAENALKYPIGSKLMTLKKDIPNFMPKVGDIYFDESGKNSIKVIDNITTNENGQKVIPVVKPDFTEVFNNYKIPNQSVILNKANVAYTKPGVTVSQSTEPTASLNGFMSFTASNNDVVHVIELDRVVLYDSAKAKDEDKKKEGQDKLSEDSKDASEGSEDDASLRKKDPGKDLAGVEEADEFGMKIWIDSGTITFHEPKFFADVDIGLLEQEIKVGFQSETEVDVTVKGNLKFNKVLEVMILGYDVKIPYGRAYVGVFLVVDAKGQVDVTTRVITTGVAEVGFKASAVCFVPYYVGPYVSYEPRTFDVGFSVDGEVYAKIAAVPQAGIVICDYDVGKLQLWMGVKSHAYFHAEGNVQGSLGNLKETSGSAEASGGLSIDAFFDIKGYLFGKKYDIFYKEFNLYDGSFKIGQEMVAENGEPDKLPSLVQLKADAYENKVWGTVKIYDKGVAYGNVEEGTPYKGNGVKVYIVHENGATDAYQAATNVDGEFELAVPIVPKDRIWAEVNGTVKLATMKKGPRIRFSKRPIKTETEEVTVYTDGAQNEGVKVYKIASSNANNKTKPTVPFDKVSFVADAFNDVVMGQVSGNYTGNVAIIHEDDKGNKVQIGAYAEEGEFLKDVALSKGHKVTVKVPFEGVYYPEVPETKEPSLPSLKINYKIQDGKILGSVENMLAEYDIQYKGKPVSEDRRTKYNNAYGGEIRLFPVLPGHGAGNVPLEKKKVTTNLSKNQITPQKPTIDPGIKLPSNKPNINIPNINKNTASKSTSTFDFNIAPVLGFALEIEYEGISKSVAYDPYGSMSDKINKPLQEDVVNVVDEKTDPIINPADQSIWAGIWETDYLGTMVVRINGNKFTASCDNGSYTMEGFISDKKVTASLGEMYENEKVELYLSEDGKSFRGLAFPDGRSKGLNFKGAMRKLPSNKILSSFKPSTSWTGVWYTDFGTMILAQEGTKVTGSFDKDENAISATITGNKIKGTFTENGMQGEFEFELLPDNSTFEGNWRYTGEEDWATWGGYKHLEN